MVDVVWLALLFPALGFLFNIFLSHSLPARAAGWIASVAVGASFVVALNVFLTLGALPADQQHQLVPLWTWLVSGDLVVQARLLVDPLSALMLRADQGLSFREIAEVVGTTEQTARWRVFKARQKLMKELGEELGFGG